MKTFLLSFVVFFFSFLSFSFAQIDDKEIEIVSFDYEKGEWDIVFSLPEGVKPYKGYDPVIIVNTVWELPAEFTKRGIELSNSSGLFLRSGEIYSFTALFYKEEGDYLYIEESPPRFMKAPEVDLLLNYHFENDNLKTEAKYFVGLEGLSFSELESYFWLVDNDTDSIIYGEGEVIEISEVNQNKFFGEKEISNNQMKKFLTCSASFENQFGEVKLRSSEIKSLLLKENDKGFVVKNVIGEGAVFPYWNDGETRNGYIFDMSGNCVKQLIVLSGEPLWFETPAGMYVLNIEGLGSQKIIKVH
jgi:hypothetical protein